MQQIGEIVKTIAKKSFSGLLKVLGIVVVGLILNVILVVVQWDMISTLWSSTSPITNHVKAIVVLIGALLFPVVYMLLAKKIALQGVLSGLFHDKKLDMVQFAVNKIYEKKPELFDEDVKVPATLQQIVGVAANIFQSLPAPVTKVMTHFIEKSGFYQLMVEELNQLKKESAGKEGAQRVDVLSNNIAAKIPEDLMKPDYLFIGVAFIINLGLFFLKVASDTASW